MKKIFLIAVVFSSFTLQLAAQSKKESIKALFSLMKIDSLMSKSFALMASAITASMSSQLKDTTYSARITKIIERNMEKSGNIAKKLINEDMVDIYDKYFTQKEIDDFVSFYKSPSGQKMINLTPDIQKDVMAVMSTKYTPTLQQEIMKEFEEMMKEAPGQK